MQGEKRDGIGHGDRDYKGEESEGLGKGEECEGKCLAVRPQGGSEVGWVKEVRATCDGVESGECGQREEELGRQRLKCRVMDKMNG